MKIKINKFIISVLVLYSINSICLAQTVLITGANKGIGLALVKQYLENNATVIATTRNIQTSDELKKLVGNKLHLIEVDLLKNNSVEKIKGAVKDQPIDIIIHNAGFFPYAAHNAPILDSKEWLDAFMIHAIIPAQITLALQDNLHKSEGAKVVAISSRRGSFSTNAEDEYRGRYGYRSSKAAMNASMQALALDLKPQNITVLILHPGRVATSLTNYDGIPPEESARLISLAIDRNELKNTGAYIDVTTGSIIQW